MWTAGPGENLYVITGGRAYYYDGVQWQPRSFTNQFTATLTPPAALKGISGYGGTTLVVARPVSADAGALYVNFKDTDPSSNLIELDSAFAIGASEMYAVGRNAFYRLSGGNPSVRTDWKPITQTQTSAQTSVDVWGSSPSDVYAIGSDVGGAKIIHYDGNPENTWMTSLYRPGDTLEAIWGVAANDVFVVGDNGLVLHLTEAEPTPTAANFPNSGWAGDFVNGHTGELVLEQVDFAFDGCFPFKFSRYYASGLTPAGQAGGSLGPNWAHNFEWHIVHTADSSTITTWRGRTLEFVHGDTGWTAADPLDSDYRLVEDTVAGRLILADAESDRMYVFDSGSDQLRSIEDRFGNKLTITYSIETGKPVLVSDGAGISLEFAYNAGKLVSVTTGADASARSVLFGYTGNQLTSVTDPTQAKAEFLYESAVSDRFITAVRLPEGNIPYRWSYGADDRVAAQADAFDSASTISYQSGTSPTAMQAPDGTDIRLQHDDDGQLVAVTNGEGEPFVMSYDGFGRVTSATDPAGVVTTFDYDPVSGDIAKTARTGAGETLFSYAAVDTVLGRS
ncbi:MAG TPA: DUF6531 domain-containing protein, partial [Woeseiaceae bacterium]|nr:DUF6531 domain-containing protein [Woeseiaceae bacterium]